MLVCKNCFSDKELRAFIESLGKSDDCYVCGSKNIAVIELTELLDFFQEFLENFRRSETGVPLRSKIQESWSFFSSLDSASKILNVAIGKINTEIENSNDLVDYKGEIISNYSYWYELKEILKTERRFIPDIDKIEELRWDGFFNTQYELTPDVKLYRARVHHQSGKRAYNSSEMMCPSPDLAKGGRANPIGIPFLYLSDNPATVLYEVRASYLDELSIGEFHLLSEKNAIRIVDFTEDTPLFQPDQKIETTIKSRLLRDTISRDLSKPMRRYDTEVDYIPTQFICEFIKVYTGASGIRFSSSLHPEGNNVVIFDQDLMECTKVTLKKVSLVNLGSTELK
ncbi:RES family NAD+ phosphorylase [Cyclobacterium marinum]|uniref:RES domain protein n=1 Tax=Cyclobacterium marinum (strain ATCC 25205 / DSM 745 / LMG 13164 / NCIMB 1802) TaxID=880070 RepID=G0J7T2_CYCMS|nr:RES family NAD+ phosphorylase [Cyclobacterium marinum]AEL27780.1 RES domain protein [Cyclobacterium marinum DSM 745]|tara:strand:+ start:2321 stop:3340 length:1020 start_codon:yes stop_codon:yes gene_type:complete